MAGNQGAQMEKQYKVVDYVPATHAEACARQ